MLFTETIFLFVFLPLALLGVAFSIAMFGHRAGMVALAIASAVFYTHWRWSDLAVISASILVNFAFARVLSIEGLPYRLGILWAGIGLNLAALAFYKYTNFFLDTIGREHLGILLPLAISFYSFQQIAFIVDVYQRRVGRMPFLNYITTVLFFPHLIAGPLIHYQAIMDQFDRRFAVNAATILVGLPVFAVGLVKKIAIADPLGIIIEPLYHSATAAPLELFSAWIAALGYTAQLYFDFSGYSDMAIGLGLMFGILLPVNFRSPYKATSIIDFWRRWHITLSSFLRDYLYIPLGGNLVSRPRWYLNLLIVMVLGGTWHGAGWTFIAWGALHGSYLVINHLWRNNVNVSVSDRYLRPIFAILTFSAVVIGWVIFRSPNLTAATHIFQGMAGGSFASLPGEILYFLPSPDGLLFGTIRCDGRGLTLAVLAHAAVAMLTAYLIIFFTPNTAEILHLDDSHRRPWYEKALPRVAAQASLIGLALFAAMFGVLGAAPSTFIYFQF